MFLRLLVLPSCLATVITGRLSVDIIVGGNDASLPCVNTYILFISRGSHNFSCSTCEAATYSAS